MTRVVPGDQRVPEVRNYEHAVGNENDRPRPKNIPWRKDPFLIEVLCHVLCTGQRHFVSFDTMLAESDRWAEWGYTADVMMQVANRYVPGWIERIPVDNYSTPIKDLLYNRIYQMFREYKKDGHVKACNSSELLVNNPELAPIYARISKERMTIVAI